MTEKLGETIALDGMTFADEAGQKIVLQSVFDRPVVLTLVYFGCVNVCTPLLEEVARAADLSDLKPGTDYRLVTISFNPHDTPIMAGEKRKVLLDAMTRTRPPADAWRVLTGEPENIRRIAAAVGFGYVERPNQGGFTHPVTVIVLAADGKIVRYLSLGSSKGYFGPARGGGLQLSPAELELAVADAKAGRARSFIQNAQQPCYAASPSTPGFVLRIGGLSLTVTVDLIILAATVVVALLFVIYVLRQGRRRKREIHGTSLK